MDIVDGAAQWSASHDNYSQSIHSTLTRCSSRMPKAIELTLLMSHPRATQKLLLNMPWMSICLSDTSVTETCSTLQWHKLFGSRYCSDDLCLAPVAFCSEDHVTICSVANSRLSWGHILIISIDGELLSHGHRVNTKQREFVLRELVSNFHVSTHNNQSRRHGGGNDRLHCNA